MSIGYTRKELGKLHKQFYEDRMSKNSDKEAFQRALMSMLKAMIDVIDANNQRIEEDVKVMIKEEVKTLIKEEAKALIKEEAKAMIKEEIKAIKEDVKLIREETKTMFKEEVKALKKKLEDKDK